MQIVTHLFPKQTNLERSECNEREKQCVIAFFGWKCSGVTRKTQYLRESTWAIAYNGNSITVTFNNKKEKLIKHNDTQNTKLILSTNLLHSIPFYSMLLNYGVAHCPVGTWKINYCTKLFRNCAAYNNYVKYEWKHASVHRQPGRIYLLSLFFVTICLFLFEIRNYAVIECHHI